MDSGFTSLVKLPLDGAILTFKYSSYSLFDTIIFIFDLSGIMIDEEILGKSGLPFSIIEVP